MKQELVKSPIGELEIRQRIRTVRGVQVMLDRDLAELYSVETKQLKRQVKRNIRRFPSDFMIELSEGDIKSLRCQFGTSNRGGDRYGAYAFTEQGIAMLSSVLRSERAIDVNISIMRAFVAIRRFVSDHAGLVRRVGAIELKQLETDKRLDTVFDALDRSKLLPCGVLPANSEYDSIRMVSRLIAQAKSGGIIVPGTCGRVRVVGFGGFAMVDPSVRRLRRPVAERLNCVLPSWVVLPRVRFFVYYGI